MNKNKKTITMKIEVGKPSVGHQANTHQVHDNRQKRKRTRQAQSAGWRKEWEILF